MQMTKTALWDIAQRCILEALDPPEGPRAPVPLANGPFFLPNNRTGPFLLEAPRQAHIYACVHGLFLLELCQGCRGRSRPSYQIGDYVDLVVIGIIPLAVDTLEGGGENNTVDSAEFCWISGANKPGSLP